jgi:hypothetical protein
VNNVKRFTFLLIVLKQKKASLMFSMGELTHEGGFGCLLYGVARRKKMVERM